MRADQAEYWCVAMGYGNAWETNTVSEDRKECLRLALGLEPAEAGGLSVQQLEAQLPRHETVVKVRIIEVG